MAAPLSSVCVFCGSSTGASPRYADTAAALGKHLAQRGVRLVYGGASVGTMGVLADAALAAGGEVVGVIPVSMQQREIAHTGVSQLHVVSGMHERKALMAQHADAFVALPGGAGTLEELFEVWTWAQIGLHAKPLGLLDVDGFYQPLLRMVDHMTQQGFLKREHRDWLVVDDGIDALLDRMAQRQPLTDKWTP